MKKILALAAIIGITGCASDDPTADLSATITNALLNGTWVRICEITGASSSFDVTLTLNEGNGTFILNSYPNLACASTGTADLNLSLTYTFGKQVTVDGSVAGITSASEIDFDFTGGAPSFDLIAIDNLTFLYFGDTDTDPNFDGSTVAKRAIKLDSAPYILQ